VKVGIGVSGKDFPIKRENEASLHFVFALHTNPAFVGIRHEAAGFGKARDGM
jgi:hypothetical protein